jgi:hypothetical protein
MVFMKEWVWFVGRSFARLRSGLVLIHSAPKPLPSQIPVVRDFKRYDNFYCKIKDITIFSHA